MTLRIWKLHFPSPPPDPGPTYLSVCVLRGVEVLLAALASMASGESEGLHGVGETSRVSAGECTVRRPWEQQDHPVPGLAPAGHRQEP